MQLNPTAFNSFLAGIGQVVDWYASVACPCVDAHSGAAKPNCPHCGGKGVIYSAKIECVVGAASQKVVKSWAQLGQYEMGDSILVVPSDSPMYEAGRWDKLVMRNGGDRFSRSLTRGKNDRLHDQIDAITRVFWFNPAGDVVEGGIPAVGANGMLTWATGEPPAGTQYSITGTRQPTYFVYDNMPSDRNQHQGALLPKNLVARRFDTMSR
ncbi:MAG: hypothetical protein AB9M53_01005 [Leptothrix sp. (in: b-proteobacteria)]